MSSTDLDAPPLKSVLIAILVVLGLHVLTAVALVAMKPSTAKIPLPKPTPPIEIELISLPAALPKETVKETLEVVKPIEKEAAKVVEKTPSLPKPQPVSKSKPKAVAETPKKPVLQKQQSEVVPPVKVEKSKPIIKEKVTQELPTKKPVQQEKQHSNIDKAVDEQQAKNQQAEQRRIVAAQAEKAAQEAANQARALQEDIQKANAKAARDAQAQADAKSENESAKKAAAMAAQKEAETAARAKAEADAKAAAAASNEPVNFTASNANWASAPNLSFPERAARRARSGDSLNVVLVLRVNKQGGIDSVRIAQSSGNAVLDKEAARQVRSGKFKPFMKNGAPVVGNVTLPVAYVVP